MEAFGHGTARYFPGVSSPIYETELRLECYTSYLQQVDDHGQLLWSAMKQAAAVDSADSRGPRARYSNLDTLLRAMRGRYSSNSLDKVCAIAFPLTKHAFNNSKTMTLPIYDPTTPISVAWGQLVSSIASTEMQGFDPSYREIPTIQLFCLFPYPSRHHWFPSWSQVQQYPDVSVRGDDTVLATGGVDCSFRLTSGCIYRGCSLHLIQPPTPQTKAVYCCTMDSKDAQLVATVPGIELDIDPRSKYVLVHLSPVRRSGPLDESVILVCEEVDTLAQPAADSTPVQPTAKDSLAIMRYRLRRVTTLEWDCRTPDDVWHRSPKHVLPFKPSLVRIEGVLQTTETEIKAITQVARFTLDGVYEPHRPISMKPAPGSGKVETSTSAPSPKPSSLFCDPAAVNVMFYDSCPNRYQGYEVYLV